MIELNISHTDDKLPLGASKFLGNPDVWDSFEWPCIELGGEMYDLAFMCQINLSQAATYDTEGVLPSTGILYFFYDLDEMPSAADNRSARVMYYDGDMFCLREMIFADENGNSISFAEQKIEFSQDSECEHSHHLLGDASKDGLIPILQIASFETEDAAISFSNGGKLCFYIEPDKLSARDFSQVKACLE